MAKTVSVKKFESMKNAASNARKRAREGRSKMKRRATLGVAAFALGKAEASGFLDRIPQPMGLPRITLVGIGAAAAGEFMSGTAGDVADGIADAALAITGYQWGKGQQVAGDAGYPLYDPATAEVVRANPGLVAGGDELDELEDEIAGYEDELLGEDELEAA